ncbi:MAG: DODA-type extradiol aromatic ring-opening family dioxygenase [Planctomycetota bacterium]
MGPAGRGGLGMSEGKVVGAFLVPNQPLPLLAPEASPGWKSLHDSYAKVRAEIEASDADLLLLFSTRWVSIIGHQMQADPEPDFWVVDEDFHRFGSLHYKLRIDAGFAETYRACAEVRGLHARTVAYRGFPIDVGSISALKMLNPDNRIPAGIVSCNVYSDRAETIVLGKAAGDAIRESGRKVILLGVSALSNRMFTEWIDPAEDHIHSLKDDEWNRKLLELLGEGRLEDVSQLSREFSRQANGDSKMKAIWWLSAAMGQSNDYRGTVFDYQPVWGTGAALVGLQPTSDAGGGLEYDEDDTDYYHGDRNVLATSPEDADPS